MLMFYLVSFSHKRVLKLLRDAILSNEYGLAFANEKAKSLFIWVKLLDFIKKESGEKFFVLHFLLAIDIPVYSGIIIILLYN